MACSKVTLACTPPACGPVNCLVSEAPSTGLMTPCRQNYPRLHGGEEEAAPAHVQICGRGARSPPSGAPGSSIAERSFPGPALPGRESRAAQLLPDSPPASTDCGLGSDHPASPRSGRGRSRQGRGGAPGQIIRLRPQASGGGSGSGGRCMQHLPRHLPERQWAEHGNPFPEPAPAGRVQCKRPRGQQGKGSPFPQAQRPGATSPHLQAEGRQPRLARRSSDLPRGGTQAQPQPNPAGLQQIAWPSARGEKVRTEIPPPSPSPGTETPPYPPKKPSSTRSGELNPAYPRGSPG